MRIGYARISKADGSQSLDLQRELTWRWVLLLDRGSLFLRCQGDPDRQLEQVPVDQLFTDKASGKDTQRPELERLLAFAHEGDSVCGFSKHFPRRTEHGKP